MNDLSNELAKAYLYMIGMMVEGKAINRPDPTNAAKHWAKITLHNKNNPLLRDALIAIYSASEDAKKVGFLQLQVGFVDQYPGYDKSTWTNTSDDLIAISSGDRVRVLRIIKNIHDDLIDELGTDIDSEKFIDAFFSKLSALDVDEALVNRISEEKWYNNEGNRRCFDEGFETQLTWFR